MGNAGASNDTSKWSNRKYIRRSQREAATIMQNEYEENVDDGHQGTMQQYAVTLDNQVVPIQNGSIRTVIQLSEQGESWTTSSTRSCSSTSSSGICSNSESESNQKHSIKVRIPMEKLRVESSPRRLVRSEDENSKKSLILPNWSGTSSAP